MNEFNKIVSYFSNFTVETVIDIIIAIGITVFFRIFSTGIANVTTKLLRKKIKKAGYGFQILIIGEGNMREEIEEKIEKCGFNRNLYSNNLLKKTITNIYNNFGLYYKGI